jgi:4-amino-4-deoxy-L-arabinose transferase-like glycosyltransferase
LAALLAGTALAYLWNITVNGMANSFYAAAARAGSRDWKALLFGSIDTGNFITVDKPPVSQWVMALSGRIFGFGSASMLIPEALLGVASVALLYGAVARSTGSRGAGLLAGAVLAVTPVAALMFRFNNPDAVMVSLMTAAAYATIRALPRADARWLVLAGVALGFAFLAKMLEGLMVLPALATAYLVVAPTTLRARILHLLGAAAALVLSSGWYVLLTMVWPASARPYLGGSANNTFMDLVVGYNGLGRFRSYHAESRDLPEFSVPRAVFRAMSWGSRPGPTRLFTDEIGFEISWLLPSALLALALVLLSRGRAPRTDMVRAAALVFGIWLIIDGAVFTMMKGGIGAYYTLAIAPAIAGLFAVGVHELWRRRDGVFGRAGAAALIATAGVWGFVVLQRNGHWFPWLRWVILVATVTAAAGLVVAAGRRRLAAALMIVGVMAGLGGCTAYALATLPVRHLGGGPTVGPADPNGPVAVFFRAEGGVDPRLDPRLVTMLRRTTTTWSAAGYGSAAAAVVELAGDTEVMAIGGFTGQDPVPTLDQFKDYVRRHRVTYYLVRQNHVLSGLANRDIDTWVAANFTPIPVGGIVAYDLSGYRG